MGGRWASDVVVYGQPIYDLTMPGLPEIPTLLLESPSFQLERLRRRTRDEVEKSLVDYDTTLREYWALTALVAGDAASQSTLASILAVDASDMVRLIDSMEKHGWAKRERDPKDRRRQIVAAGIDYCRRRGVSEDCGTASGSNAVFTQRFGPAGTHTRRYSSTHRSHPPGSRSH